MDKRNRRQWHVISSGLAFRMELRAYFLFFIYYAGLTICGFETFQPLVQTPTFKLLLIGSFVPVMGYIGMLLLFGHRQRTPWKTESPWLIPERFRVHIR